MNLQDVLASIPADKPYKIRQPRLWSLVHLLVSDSDREKMSALDLVGISGQYLLGFNFPPRVDEYFPYENHIWQIIAEPVQFPTRYRSRTVKKSPLIFARYVESQTDEMQMLGRLLELSTNSN